MDLEHVLSVDHRCGRAHAWQRDDPFTLTGDIAALRLHVSVQIPNKLSPVAQ